MGYRNVPEKTSKAASASVLLDGYRNLPAVRFREHAKPETSQAVPVVLPENLLFGERSIFEPSCSKVRPELEQAPGGQGIGLFALEKKVPPRQAQRQPAALAFSLCSGLVGSLQALLLKPRGVSAR